MNTKFYMNMKTDVKMNVTRKMSMNMILNMKTKKE